MIIAIGNPLTPLFFKGSKGLEQSRKGTIVANEETGVTYKCGVFAGGDVVTGAATVISAMGASKKAVRTIDEHLKGK